MLIKDRRRIKTLEIKLVKKLMAAIGKNDPIIEKEIKKLCNIIAEESIKK